MSLGSLVSKQNQNIKNQYYHLSLFFDFWNILKTIFHTKKSEISVNISTIFKNGSRSQTNLIPILIYPIDDTHNQNWKIESDYDYSKFDQMIKGHHYYLLA